MSAGKDNGMISQSIKYFIILTVVALGCAGCGSKQEQAGQTKTAATTETKAVQDVAKADSESIQEQPVVDMAPITEEKTIFGFENGDEGFEIPSWAEEKADNAGRSVSISKSFASEGSQSLCINAEFPGKIWTSALVELEQYLDLSDYREIACDIYIPESAPMGLKAKLILTVGEDWTWCEMVSSVPLNPGEWVTVRASIEPGSMAWKRTEVDNAFRADIRKLVVRIESNKRPEYSGPIFIDNIRVGK